MPAYATSMAPTPMSTSTDRRRLRQQSSIAPPKGVARGPTDVKSLTWDQVNAWRLARHGLAPHVGFMEAMRRMIGVQAQVMSAAELSLWARVDGLRPADVQAALWRERALVKTWAMRGTLFLFAAEDLPLVVAARNARGSRYKLKHFESYSISEPQFRAFVRATRKGARSAPNRPRARRGFDAFSRPCPPSPR